jgi:hypothetical protein
MNRKLHVLGHLLWGSAVVAGFGAVVMLLWNAVVPSVFGLGAVSFWQALGLLALGRILVGSSTGFGRRRHGLDAHFRSNPFHRKWQNMTPGEREEFIRRHRHFDHTFRHFVSGFSNGEESGKKD